MVGGSVPIKPIPSIYIGNILLSKELRSLSLPSKSVCKFSRTSSVFCFFSEFFVLVVS